MIGVSGTALSLASIFIDQQNFNEEELHEIKIDIDNIQAINKRILKMTEAEISQNLEESILKELQLLHLYIFIRNNS